MTIEPDHPDDAGSGPSSSVGRRGVESAGEHEASARPGFAAEPTAAPGPEPLGSPGGGTDPTVDPTTVELSAPSSETDPVAGEVGSGSRDADPPSAGDEAGEIPSSAAGAGAMRTSGQGGYPESAGW